MSRCPGAVVPPAGDDSDEISVKPSDPCISGFAIEEIVKKPVLALHVLPTRSRASGFDVVASHHFSGSSLERNPGEDVEASPGPNDRAIKPEVQSMIGGDRPVGQPFGGHLDDTNAIRQLGLDLAEMTGELGELGLDGDRDPPRFDLELNGRFDLNSGRSRAGTERGATVADQPAGAAERQWFIRKISPGFHEGLVAHRVAIWQRVESPHPVSGPANAQRAGISFHSNNLKARKLTDGLFRGIGSRWGLAPLSSGRVQWLPTIEGNS